MVERWASLHNPPTRDGSGWADILLVHMKVGQIKLKCSLLTESITGQLTWVGLVCFDNLTKKNDRGYIVTINNDRKNLNSIID